MWRFLWLLLVAVPGVLVAASLALVAGGLRLPRPAADLAYRGFSRWMLWGLGIRLRAVVRHGDAADLPAQLVIVANHESQLDPLALTEALSERSIRFIAKRQLFRIPLFGWAMYATGSVAVTRSSTDRDLSTLADARARARDRDVAFFAEGTRSRDGSLGPFKRGAFAFAITHGRTILPVGIAGTRACLASHSLRPHRGELAVVVGTPIPAQGLSLEDRGRLCDQTREIVAALKAEAAELLGPAGRPPARVGGNRT